uniref:Uncharacterized protein n=1 Tax=Cannabis sativa TaxID=3483 RepID=A0A803Q1B9_CANSA
MLAATHSPELEVPEPPRVTTTPGDPTEEVLGNQKVVLIKEEEEVPTIDQKWKGMVPLPEPSKKPKRSATPGPSSDSRILVEAEDFLAPPAILLTLAHLDKERVQLHIAKHNYAVDKLSKGNAEAKALKK